MFKIVKVVSIILFISNCSISVAQLGTESPKDKEIRVETDINNLFKAVIVSAAKDLNKDQTMRPFAIVKKADGSTGLYQSDESDKNKNLSVVDQASAIRNLLTGLANSDQIIAYAQATYVNIQKDGSQSQQGISVELEHKEGVSIMRFLPVEPVTKDEKKVLDFKINNVSTAKKPTVVFALSNL